MPEPAVTGPDDGLNDLPPVLQRRPGAMLLALISGAILPGAFAPYDLPWLALVSMSLLFLLVREASWRKTLVLAYLFGVGYFGVGVHWVYHSIHLFGEAVAPLAAVVTLGFILMLSLFPVLAMVLYRRLGGHLSGPGMQAALFAACWMVTELLRGWLFGGFPWLLLGYSQTTSWFGALAPLIGVYGVSFVLVLVAALLGVLVIAFRWTTRLLAIGPCVLLVVLAGVVKPAEWSRARDHSLSVRMVQGNIEQSLKFDRERFQSSIRTYVQHSLDSPPDTDLVIWPETAIPTSFERIVSSLADHLRPVTERGVVVLSGGFQREDDGRVFNAFRALNAEGRTYRKHHLVPFGEFMPFRSLLEFLSQFILIPMSDLSEGEWPPVPLEVRGESLGVSICYEDVFGEEIRHLLPAATLLVNVSNDAWFGQSAAPWQHQQIASMRARETSRPMLRVTNTGVTSVIDHQGRVLQSIGLNVEGVLDVVVTPRTGETPYVKLGNYPVFAAVLLTLLLQLLLWQRKARSQREHG